MWEFFPNRGEGGLLNSTLIWKKKFLHIFPLFFVFPWGALCYGGLGVGVEWFEEDLLLCFHPQPSPLFVLGLVVKWERGLRKINSQIQNKCGKTKYKGGSRHEQELKQLAGNQSNIFIWRRRSYYCMKVPYKLSVIWQSMLNH